MTIATEVEFGSTPVESRSSAVYWGPIVAGAFAASTLTLILMLVGSGLGLTMISPWSGAGAGVTTVAVSTAIWLVVVQWLSAGVGGYLTGRLRTRWVDIHTDETAFRDTAHGFMSWALATLIIVFVMGSALSSLVGGGVQAAGSVLAASATAAAGPASGTESGTEATGYFVDSLFRPADAARLAGNGDNAAAAAEATRILVNGAVAGGVGDDDKAYLGQLVAARTGLSQADATKRVTDVLNRVSEAKTKAKQAADAARKAAATIALAGALSLVIGAFIASVAAALGGKQRDEDEALFLSR